MRIAKLSMAVACLCFIGIATQQCSKEQNESSNGTLLEAKAQLDAPVLSFVESDHHSITVNVQAGASGAQGGFSLHWMTYDAFVANGGVWPSDESLYCQASFSGNANSSRYKLNANGSVDVTVGYGYPVDNGATLSCTDEMACNTEYVFRAFFHNVPKGANKSNWSSNIVCTTDECSGQSGCTYTQGYWKNHSDFWPLANITLGSISYTANEALTIFNTPPSGGNTLLQLAHQLVAAKLSIANGADDTDIASVIADADALIGSTDVMTASWPASHENAEEAGQLATALDDYNNGLTGPGHCD